MSEVAVKELIVLASTAGGLVLFGAFRFVLSSRSATMQFSAAVFACALPALGRWFLASPVSPSYHWRLSPSLQC